MARLSEDEKHQIVRLLAQHASPSRVVVEMRELYGVQVDRFQVRAYDPTNPKFEAGERWRAIFQKERLAYEQSIEEIPISHKAFRLNELQKSYFLAQRSGNIRLACRILAQAAKEVGGVLSHRGQNIADGDTHGFRQLTSEQRKAYAAELIREALQRPRVTENGRPHSLVKSAA